MEMEKKKMKKDETQSPRDRLPVEIIITIFTLLCIKSLFTFRSVCKTWRSVVDDSSFPMMHFANLISETIQTPSTFIMLPRLSKRNLSFKFVQDQDDGLVKYPKITVPFLENSKLFSVGSCNSLLCFSNWYRLYPIADDGEEHEFVTYICNPATGNYFRLPEFTMPEYKSVCVASGFGCDPFTNDFKVILICEFHCDHEKNKKRVHLYSLRTNSWKMKAVKQKIRLPTGEAMGVFVNGFVHWSMKDAGLYRIVSFNMGSEKFGIVPMPPELQVSPDYGHMLHHGALGGCLCVSYCSFEEGSNHCEIWIMEKYNVRESWVRRFVIDLDVAGRSSIRVILPVWICKNGDLLLQCGYNFLVSYNPESGEATRFEDESFEVYPYVGSLISPNQLQM